MYDIRYGILGVALAITLPLLITFAYYPNAFTHNTMNTIQENISKSINTTSIIKYSCFDNSSFYSPIVPNISYIFNVTACS